MKSLRQSLLDDVNSGASTLVRCVRITRQDGNTFYYTEHDEPLKMDGQWDGTQVNTISPVTYKPFPSLLTESAITQGSESGATSLDLRGALDDDENQIERADVQAGLWDFADVWIFRTIWADPVEDDDPLSKGRFGQVTLRDNELVVQYESLSSLLQTSIGRTHEPLCAWELGDSRCHGEMPSFEVSGIVDEVRDSGVTVEDVSLAGSRPNDFYGRGELRVDTGANAGDARVIKDYDESGIITLWQPFFFDLQAGDSYRMVPGCRKRKIEDCRDKYDNVKRHGGFADMPLQDDTSKFGTPE